MTKLRQQVEVGKRYTKFIVAYWKNIEFLVFFLQVAFPQLLTLIKFLFPPLKQISFNFINSYKYIHLYAEARKAEHELHTTL